MLNKIERGEARGEEIIHPEVSSVRVFPTLQDTAQAAANEIAELVKNKPGAAITYATGETMIPVYGALAKSGVDFSGTTAFHLDEYSPISPDDQYSFVNFLRERVFGPLRIGNVFEMNGLAEDPEAEAARYEELLRSRQIDLAILGIGPYDKDSGTGCHIAFNESGTSFGSRTHLAQLSQTTLDRDRKERGQNTPEHALTQGIANILDAAKILMVAYGNKGYSLAGALYEEISPLRPASALRSRGEKVTILIDQNAANIIRLCTAVTR